MTVGDYNLDPRRVLEPEFGRPSLFAGLGHPKWIDQRTGRVRGFGISSQFPPSLNTADVAASLYNCNFSSHWALVIAFPPLALQSNGWEWLLTVISLSILQDPFFTPLTP